MIRFSCALVVGQPENCCMSLEAHVLLCSLVGKVNLDLRFRWWCYRTQVQLLTAKNPIIRETSANRKEGCFNQKRRQSGEKVDSCPKTNSKVSAQPWQFLKGKRRKESQWVIKAGGWVLHPSPLCAGWLTLSSDVICPCDLLAGLLRGADGGRELVIL